MGVRLYVAQCLRILVDFVVISSYFLSVWVQEGQATLYNKEGQGK